jgi:hypothetical protein
LQLETEIERDQVVGRGHHQHADGAEHDASLVYGFTGTVSFPGIVTALDGPSSFGIVLGIVFVAAGAKYFRPASVDFTSSRWKAAMT